MRVDLDAFEQRYRTDPDPWQFATSPYEQHKYRTTLANLPRSRYRRCFEPGCSIGVLTELLSDRADHVVACDPSPTATATARRRLRHLSHVDVVTAPIPDWWPTGTFDLVVMSEIGYYWDEPDLRGLLDRVVGSLTPGGDLLAVHWQGNSTDHLLTGQEVHAVIESVFGPADRTITNGPSGATVSDTTGYLLQRWTIP